MEPHLFNNDSCSCTCDSSPYQRDKTHCTNYSDRKWDPLTCSCRYKDETIMYECQKLKMIICLSLFTKRKGFVLQGFKCMAHRICKQNNIIALFYFLIISAILQNIPQNVTPISMFCIHRQWYIPMAEYIYIYI